MRSKAFPPALFLLVTLLSLANATVAGVSALFEPWLDQCRGEMEAGEFLASKLDVDVFLLAPGCTIGMSGQIRVRNDNPGLWFKVRVTAEFGNRNGPSQCGTPCNSPCACMASSGTEPVVLAPETTQYFSCAFPYCPSCTSCNNPVGLCPSDPDLFCSALWDRSFTIEAVSVDGGLTWLDILNDLGISEPLTIPFTTNNPCV